MDELKIGPDGKIELPQPESISEKERSDAMGAYLMMFAALAIGLPLPFLNIIAAIVYFAVNKKSRFSAFHAYQSLISQIVVSIINAGIVIWIIIGAVASSFDSYLNYFGIPFFIYLFVAIVLNVFYIVISIKGCIKANKGILYYMPIFGKISFDRYYGSRAANDQKENACRYVNHPPGK